MVTRITSRAAWTCAGALWLGTVAWGFATLHRHAGTAGDPATPPRTWPHDASLLRDAERPTLLFFAHPRCPCTLAGIGELDRLLAQCSDRVRTVVLFYGDPALGDDWLAGSTSYARATAIPGVTTLRDPLGVAARRFGVRTSGTVCVYLPDGSLGFHGGLTPARGHAGDSDGRAALLTLLLNVDDRERTGSTPVFGCSLLAPAGNTQ